MFGATQAHRLVHYHLETEGCNQEGPPAMLQSPPTHQCDDAKGTCLLLECSNDGSSPSCVQELSFCTLNSVLISL